MALFLSHKEPLYRWGVWKMDESVDTLLDLLPEREYYEREVQRFVASHRRLEWLSVRALLLSAEWETVSGGLFIFHQHFPYERLCVGYSE